MTKRGIKKQPKGLDIMPTSLRIPGDIHKYLVKKAADNHDSVTRTILQMLRQFMDYDTQKQRQIKVGTDD